MINTKAVCDGGSCEPRTPVSKEILAGLEMLAVRADSLAVRANDVLAPVMVSSNPPPTGTEGKLKREYPPLFSKMRELIEGINNSLESIESNLSRTEL